VSGWLRRIDRHISLHLHQFADRGIVGRDAHAGYLRLVFPRDL
jgi:hypothetical protein